MKKYAVEFESELFGHLKVAVTEKEISELDIWVGLNDLLDVNIFVHPDDEDMAFDGNVLGSRWLVSIWACKRDEDGVCTTNEELEAISLSDVREL